MNHRRSGAGKLDSNRTSESFAKRFPGWVPGHARRYLLHTELGHSIRNLAREAGCHASTILRQIRRTELQRDDPLIDLALLQLAQHLRNRFHRSDSGGSGAVEQKRNSDLTPVPNEPVQAPLDDTVVNRETVRVLRRLCETGSVLAVAENMDKAVVVRDDDTRGTVRTAVVDVPVASALALQDWISCPKPGRISRYYITAAGRAALNRLLAENESRMRAYNEVGFSEAQTNYAHQQDQPRKGLSNPGPSAQNRTRYNTAESPLVALARRKDKDGANFLDDMLVQAGERLREDFELAQMGPNITQNWDNFLAGGVYSGPGPDLSSSGGTSAARERLSNALKELGPGLSDVALRCCCFLEGLESAEKRLGWSARSGKIVLRIALQRLRQHYEQQSGLDRLIG